MLFSKTCRSILFFTSLLSANAETIRGAQQERELTTVEAVNLGSAGDYTILTKSGISAVAGTAITGDIAVSPIAATGMTGFGLSLPANGMSSTSSLVTEGTVYASDYAVPTPALLTTAISDMEAAYTAAAGRARNSDEEKYLNRGAGDIGGLILEPGVYKFDTGVNISSTVTLEGTDVTTGSTDIFIIQMMGDLMLSADTEVILTKGVLAKNVFWQVAGAVEVRSDATMEGILLVQTDVTFVTGSTLNGRVLAQTACVLQKATITPA